MPLFWEVKTTDNARLKKLEWLVMPLFWEVKTTL